MTSDINKLCELIDNLEWQMSMGAESMVEEEKIKASIHDYNEIKTKKIYEEKLRIKPNPKESDLINNSHDNQQNLLKQIQKEFGFIHAL